MVIFKQLLDVLSEYSTLEVDYCDAELRDSSLELAEIREIQNQRAAQLVKLQEAMESLLTSVQQLEDESEELKKELDTAQKIQKKTTKKIGNLKNLNATCANIEIRTNDKEKICKMIAKFDLTRRELKTNITDDNKVWTVSPQDLNPQFGELDDNQSKREKRSAIWNTVGNASGNNAKWNELLNN